MSKSIQYRIEVQVSPQIVAGNLAHYWAIQQITSDGTFTVAHGYESKLGVASLRATEKAGLLGLVD